MHTLVLLGFVAVSPLCFGNSPTLLVSAPKSLLLARAPAPKAPFHFLKEEQNGGSPKVLVRDGRGAVWQVKFGHEVQAETFATKLVSAVGYYSDVTHYVERGRILGAHGLQRAAQHIDASGNFKDARFEYRDPKLRFLKHASWTWDKNPFAGTREFKGLKILVMLLSNWDNKDASNRTTNTGVIERSAGTASRRIYYLTDWGGSMGKWGRLWTRDKWDCEGFAEQSEKFIKKVEPDGQVVFGFSSGNHSGDFKDDIYVGDVRWLVGRLNRITDSQLRAALKQSGASAHEAEHFARSLRLRITQLESAASIAARSPQRFSRR